MTSKTRNVVAVVAGMAAAGTAMHLVGTFLHVPPVQKSIAMMLGAGAATVLVLYLFSRGADEE